MVTIDKNILIVSEVKPSDRPQIKRSQDACDLFKRIWSNDTIDYFEIMKLMLVNRANKVLGVTDLSFGSISGTILDIRIVLQYAIKGNASGIILCHNHPSGNIQPSESDISITKKLKEAALTMDIALLDHLIITSGKDYFSFADNGLI